MTGPLLLCLLAFGTPANDECAGAPHIDVGLIPGSTAGATTSATTGDCATVGADVWFVYVPPANGSLEVDTGIGPGGSADFDTVLAVFTGECGDLDQVACNDEQGIDPHSYVELPVGAGIAYFIELGGFFGDTGNYELDVKFTPDVTQGPATHPTTGHTYQLLHTPQTFLQARARAANLGGYLAAITDAQEQAFVDAAFPTQKFWIGLSDELSESFFLWDSGEAFAYQNWMTGQPNDFCFPAGGTEDYAYFDPTDGEWADASNTFCGGTLLAGLVEVPGPSPFADLEVTGPGCADGAPPTLFSELPLLGQTLHVAVTGVAPGASGLLLLSGAPAGSFTVHGCEVFLDLGTFVVLTPLVFDAFGAWSVTAAVPTDTDLIGVELALQAAVLASELEFSSGLLLTFGL